MTTIDTLEPGEQPPPHRARIQWGVAEVSAAIAIVAALLAGLGGIIKIAIAQDRTERTANDAKIVAESAAREVGGIRERLAKIEEQVKRIEGIDTKIDRLLERRQ